MTARPKYRVAVDWIAFRLTLPSASNFWSVKSVFDSLSNRAQWAESISPGAGGAATVFEVKLQDPPVIRGLWAELQDCWPGCTATLTGMEIALDTYLQDSDMTELAWQLMEQFKWMEFASGGGWHLYRKKGERVRSLDAGGGLSERDLVDYLVEQWQLADHPTKDVPVRFHLHVKRTDADQRALPKRKWRARFEVTLKDDALPWRDVAELASADFTELQTWFRFRKASDHAVPALAAALKSRNLPAGYQPGRRGRYRRPATLSGMRRRGYPNRYRSLSMANMTQNAAVYDQFRRIRGTRAA